MSEPEAQWESFKATIVMDEWADSSVVSVESGDNRYSKHDCHDLTEQCRYDDPGLPCKLCEARGFPCGPKEKAQSSKAQLHQTPSFVFIPSPPPTSTDDLVTNSDARYLQAVSDYGYTLESPGIRDWLVMCGGNLLESNGIVSCHAPIVTFHVASKLYRFACLAFAASHGQREKNNPDALMYLGKFYKYANEAISSSSFTEIIVASYMVLLRELECMLDQHPHKRFESLGKFVTYFKGMWDTVWEVRFHPSRQPDFPLSLICLQTIVLLHDAYFNAIYHESTLELDELEVLRQVHVAIESAFDSVVASSIIQEEWQTRQALRYCFDIYLDIYLALRTRAESYDLIDLPPLLASVKRFFGVIIQHIIVLVPHSPVHGEIINLARRDGLRRNFQYQLPPGLDTVEVSEVMESVVLYGLANLIGNGILMPQRGGSLSHALFLGRLCALLPGRTSSPSSVFQERRSMFWSGVFVTRATDTAGTS
jgi:hypothetical protein